MPGAGRVCAHGREGSEARRGTAESDSVAAASRPAPSARRPSAAGSWNHGRSRLRSQEVRHGHVIRPRPPTSTPRPPTLPRPPAPTAPRWTRPSPRSSLPASLTAEQAGASVAARAPPTGPRSSQHAATPEAPGACPPEPAARDPRLRRRRTGRQRAADPGHASRGRAGRPGPGSPSSRRRPAAAVIAGLVLAGLAGWRSGLAVGAGVPSPARRHCCSPPPRCWPGSPRRLLDALG